MKLTCESDCMNICPESHPDIAYLRSVFGLKKPGDKVVFELGFSGDPGDPSEVFLSTERDWGKQTPREYMDYDL